jgi:hypothetical protein
LLENPGDPILVTAKRGNSFERYRRSDGSRTEEAPKEISQDIREEHAGEVALCRVEEVENYVEERRKSIKKGARRSGARFRL